MSSFVAGTETVAVTAQNQVRLARADRFDSDWSHGATRPSGPGKIMSNGIVPVWRESSQYATRAQDSACELERAGPPLAARHRDTARRARRPACRGRTPSQAQAGQAGNPGHWHDDFKFSTHAGQAGGVI